MVTAFSLNGNKGVIIVKSGKPTGIIEVDLAELDINVFIQDGGYFPDAISY